MKILNMLFILFFSHTLMAENTKPIKSKPNKATVFLYGAELTHTETIPLLSGTNEIVVEGISPQADESSISAYFKGALVIDTRKQVKYPESPKTLELDAKYNTTIHDIQDSLKWLSFDLKDIDNKILALGKEKNLLLNNRLMRGEFIRDSIPLLEASLNLMRSRLMNIDESLLALEKKQYKLQTLYSKLEERLNYFQVLVNQNLNGFTINQYKATYQIIVTIEAEAAMTGALVLKYYVSSAGWVPKYDINAGSTSEKLELIYRGQVYQNTQIDWSNISLTLSTSNPNQGNTKPVLTTWNLFYGYPNSYPSFQYNNQKGAPQNYNMIQRPSIKSKNLQEDVSADMSEVKSAEPVFTVSENMMRAEYVIKTKYSIESDNKAHNVIINKEDIPVTYAFMAVPKLDNNAFLMGKIINWEDLNLLPAAARIYFDDSYIGVTAIDPNTVKDTLYLDLGRDKSITIKRQNLKEKCKEQVIGDDRIVTKTVEITIRNTKSMEIAFELEDQIPITADNTIKIELLKSDGAIHNDLTGKLTWKLKIKPKETKRVVFSFEVRYPKDKVIGAL